MARECVTHHACDCIQARVKELEAEIESPCADECVVESRRVSILKKENAKLRAEVEAWKSAAKEANLRTYDGMYQDNQKLKKVVDAAKKACETYWNFDVSMKTEIQELERAIACVATVNSKEVDMNILVVRAAQFARDKHSEQKRKYTGEPYFNHCAEVAELVRSIGCHDVMIAAAYLHDVVEDCGVPLTTLEQEFGKDVADLVGWLTDVSKPEDGNRAKRKAIDRQHTAQATPAAKTIKLADMISNSRTIVQYDPDFARVYMKEKALLLPCLAEGDAELYGRAKEILDAYAQQAIDRSSNGSG